MTILQSIRRTPVPGAHHDREHRTYREVWPEFRLKVASAKQRLPGAAGKIYVAVVDSGVPSGESGGPFDERGRSRASGKTADHSLDRDDDGHATDLAATIRGLNMHSAPNIDIRFIKAFSTQGWPAPGRGADAIKRAAALGARVIVLAWDTGHTTDELRQAILAVRKTAVVVIAAGNWSLDNDKYPNWPANYGGKNEMDHVITVMATDERDERASFSSYGRRSVYIAAPGFASLEAAPSSSPLRTAGSLRNGYREFRGTSAATAHVARLAALVLAKNPRLRPKQVKQHIGKTARKVGSLRKRCATGAIADFAKALK